MNEVHYLSRNLDIIVESGRDIEGSTGRHKTLGYSNSVLSIVDGQKAAQGLCVLGTGGHIPFADELEVPL
jgi:hypothetical protein